MSENSGGSDAAQLARALMVTADRLDAAITKLHGGNTNTIKVQGAGGIIAGVVLGLAFAGFLHGEWSRGEDARRTEAALREQREAIASQISELRRRADRQEDYQNTVFQMIPEIRNKVADAAAARSPHQEVSQQ